MPPSSALDRAQDMEAEGVAPRDGQVPSPKLPVVEQVVEPVQEPAQAQEAQVQVPAVAATCAAPAPRNVHFADADVIEFEPTVWTSTVASDGAPVGLSNKVRRRTRHRLDSWEDERAPCRVLREEYMENGYLEPEERLDILEAAGHAISTVHHVEHDTIRINRERWESNEQDLRYQYGLGEVVDLDNDDEEDDRLLLHGFAPDDENDEIVNFDDDDAEMLDEDDDAESLHSYYYGHTAVLGDEEDDMRVAMDAMDSYDTRKFDEWAWDYSNDAMLADNDNQSDTDNGNDSNANGNDTEDHENNNDNNNNSNDNQVPYPEDLFDLHELDNDGDFSEMSTSPNDISATSDCGLTSRFEVPTTKPAKESQSSDLSVDPAAESTTAHLAPYAIV